MNSLTVHAWEVAQSATAPPRPPHPQAPTNPSQTTPKVTQPPTTSATGDHHPLLLCRHAQRPQALPAKKSPALPHLQLHPPATTPRRPRQSHLRRSPGSPAPPPRVLHHRLRPHAEHVHLLLSEPAARTLDVTLRVLKTQTAKRRKQKHAPLWAPRYYDFNVFTEAKRIEKLRYIHRNPVTRGLVAHPEDWPWSSFVHYATGTPGRVEIESPWTAQKRALPMCPNKNRAL
jgi:hypothetical protein